MTQSTGHARSSGGGYRRIAFPPERRLVLDTLYLGHRKPMMHGLLEVDGRLFALAHVVRGINRRSVREISDEIRAVQGAGMHSLSPGLRAGSRFFLRLPGFLRRSVYRVLLRSPRFAKRHTGTMLVSSVGMFSGGAGWGFSAPGIHNLSIVVGGIASRAPAATGELGPCEMLCLTVSANHELVDGAPLARFVHHLTEQVERAECLLESVEKS